MIGRTISRYQVKERLGGGGMGEVYRAHDERLGRDVALKILAPGRGTVEDRDRIRAEARTLSRLSHPGISTVFDVESADGVDFLVLELVRGQTLQERLRRIPVPERLAREWGAQIAEALAAAHEQGIIHRDLKPANVMISPEGRIKILDFGLALRCPSALEDHDTTADADSDLVVGTLAYMSPEQMLGRPLDTRSDLYSLGVLLFEMATGRLPFDVSPATALINHVLNEEAPRARSVEPTLSEAFDAEICRLLQKDPDRRPALAHDVRRELLRRDAAGAGARIVSPVPRRAAEGRAAVASIAVLPLSNLTDAPEQEFFADGVTEAIIERLARVRSLRVVSRTSIMGYKGVRRPLVEIAQELGVDAVVEGAVSRLGNRVRITAQLIDAREDRHLWAKSYERDVAEMLELQSEVVRAIADEVRAQVTPQDAETLRRAPRVDAEAYEEYLRGRFHWNRRNEVGLRKAIEHFGRSIALDPDYTSAYAGLADAYVTMGIFNFAAPADAFARARAAVSRVLVLDEMAPEALLPLAAIQFHADWDFEASLATYRRALELAPNLPDAHHWYADVLSALGKHDEAIEESRLAQRLDPLSLAVNTDIGLHLFYARRYDEAIAQQRRTLELDPTFGPALRSLGGAHEEKREFEEAIDAYRRAQELATEDLSARALLAHAYAVSGRETEARALLDELRAASAARYVSRYALAAIHVGLGEPAEALSLLEEAFVARDRGVVWLGVSPRFDPIREEPRFRDLLKRLGLSTA
jgi:serine/threonine-protein kinase